jgi:hypothetical protein
MRKYLLIMMSIFCLSLTAQEQKSNQAHRPRMTSEEFRTKQQEYITRKAELTEEESAAFFPLYFELQSKKHQANRNAWKQARAVAPKDRTEEDCAKMVDALADVKIECATLEKEYLQKFKKILPAKKLMRVQMAEDGFQRELLRGMQQNGHRPNGPWTGSQHPKGSK